LRVYHIKYICLQKLSFRLHSMLLKLCPLI